MSVWQDIGTAPKDGSIVLATYSINKNKPRNIYRLVRWRESELVQSGGYWQEFPGGGLFSYQAFDGWSHYRTAAVWMPLPEPPQNEEQL